MDRASSLIFPGSRTLVGWWRQLQPYHPQSLHVGYGYVHRVEAPVEVQHLQPVDAFTQLVLKALGLQQTGAAQADASGQHDGLGERLGLPAPILRQILLDMQKTGLLCRGDPHGWHITERGRQALYAGRFPTRLHERRVFAFLENLTPLGARTGQPSFVPLAECPAVAWHVGEAMCFEPGLLHACVAQSAEWKMRRGFPLDVEVCAQEAFAPAWQQVVVDRPERLLMVLIQAGRPPASEWIGFAAKADGWSLYDQTPILRLPAAPDVLEGADAPTSPMWQEAWRSWCRQRHLPMNEVEACTLSYRPPQLDIQAPDRFVQRLRAAKSDLFRGEAWILVGDGYFRTAALLSLASA